MERRAAGAHRRHAPRPARLQLSWNWWVGAPGRGTEPNTRSYNRRYQYAVSFPDQHGYGGYGVVKYDRTTGARRVHRAGDARLPGEAAFVPAAGATREDDGYLLTVVSDLKQDASQLLVLDASGLDRIATVHLPRRVTGGIHGSWIPDTDLDTSAD
ncbi:carotenoid oxygenase family protein [Streptomyces mirabilis]|uniref:carotenoid oxygenase family protein n=1 Tax=Streptomyces mirabilis TaxID=68239 RepID=UPI00367F1D53